MCPSPEDVLKKTASLARLALSPEEEAALGGQFQAILEHFKELGELDVEGVEPMTGPTDVEDVLREDEPRPSLTPDQALANAPERKDDYYSVPKTIGGDA